MFMEQLVSDRKIAEATHNIMAYRIKMGNAFASDNDDDGESGGKVCSCLLQLILIVWNVASSGLLHLLHAMKSENVVVVVSRWFGGVLLGPKRFKFINNVARELLVEKAGE